MPGKAVDLLTRIGEPVRNLKLSEHARWGRVRVGAKMRKGEALFPRLDEKEVRLALAEYLNGDAPAATPAAVTATTEEALQINIEDFRKIELRTANVISAERIAGSDKLLKLQVDVGGKPRQIVAGIAEHYSPEQMVGKQIVVVANLKPAKLRGEVSEGMLLAVKWDKQLEILTPPSDAPSGSPIS